MKEISDGEADPQAPFLADRAAWSAENLSMYRSGGGDRDGPSPDQHREDGFKNGFESFYERATSDEGPPGERESDMGR